MNSWKDQLEAFRNANPGLPEGPADEPQALPAADSLPSASRLIVAIERKGRGGKTVTRISGFNDIDESVERMASTLKKALGSGGAVEPDGIIIQGDRREQVASWLVKAGYKVSKS